MLLVQNLRDKIELEKKHAEAEKTRIMGKFNAFSRPKTSLVNSNYYFETKFFL